MSVIPWSRHKMETFSALLAIIAGNSPVTGEFPAQRPVTRSFGVFSDLSLNKRLSNQSWGWWFETQSRPLWRHCNDADGMLITWIPLTFVITLNFPTIYISISSLIPNTFPSINDTFWHISYAIIEPDLFFKLCWCVFTSYLFCKKYTYIHVLRFIKVAKTPI